MYWIFFKICWPPKFMSAKCLKIGYPRQFPHLKYSNYTPDKVSSFLSMLFATTIASSLSLHPSVKTTPPVCSRRFNWSSAYSVSNSSRIVYDISWPYLSVILMSSVLFVSDLMTYRKSIFLGVLILPCVVAQIKS